MLHRTRIGIPGFLLVACMGLTSAGCGGDEDESRVTAVSFNMYIGFGRGIFAGDFDLSDPEEQTEAFNRAFEQFQQTDPLGRIQGAGEFIANEEPDTVGLQEVISITLTKGTEDPADDTALVDFLDDLLDAIEDAGGPSYQSFLHANNEVEGTLELFGSQEPFVFREGDAILVHPRWSAQTVGSGLHFSELLSIGQVSTPGGVQERFFIRGVHHVRATQGDLSLELFNTHLEVFGSGGISEPIQIAQAQEMMEYIAAETSSALDRPVVLTGDMNGRPGSTTYSTITGAGFLDAFAEAGSGAGLTCCQDGDLQNTTSTASGRIDYVFVIPGSNPSTPSITESRVVLNERVERVNEEGLIWPSDHFGILAELEFP